MTTRLERLTTQGAAEIDEAFATGESPIDRETFENHSEPVPGKYDVDFDPIDAVVETVEDEHRQYSNQMDTEVAPVVHREIAVPRRVATDARLWQRLATVELRDYVRHRWDPSGAILEKFRGSADDIYSNAIVRLWWIAELTHVPSDSELADVIDVDDEYELTRAAFDYSFLSNRIVDNAFHRSKPVVVAVVDQFRDSPQDLVNDMPDRINTALSLMPAEGWVEDNPVEFVENVKSRMETE